MPGTNIDYQNAVVTNTTPSVLGFYDYQGNRLLNLTPYSTGTLGNGLVNYLSANDNSQWRNYDEAPPAVPGPGEIITATGQYNNNGALVSLTLSWVDGADAFSVVYDSETT